MKVQRVEVYRLKPAMADRPFPVTPVVCRVVAENGVCGYGEAGIAAGRGGSAVCAMTAELAGELIGWDVWQANRFFGHINTTAYGHVSGGGAILYSALSALDIAMCDVQARLLDVPVYKLLGGKWRDEVECYASQVHDGWRSSKSRLVSPEDFAQAAELVLEDGFPAAKFNFHALDRLGEPVSNAYGRNPSHRGSIGRLVRERLEAVRARVGDDLILISESLNGLCMETAREVDAAAYEYGVAYMEEYFWPYDPALYKSAAEHFKTPMACGEKLFGRKGFLPYFRDRSIGVAQPDITMCGGLHEAKGICEMAEAFEIGIQPHLCGTPIAAAATLQLEASLSNFVMHEFLVTGYSRELIEYTQDCAAEKLIPVGGRIAIPDQAGIGVSLSEKAMREAVETIVID